MRRRQRETFGGVTGSTGAIILQVPGDRQILEATEDERLAMLDERGFGASRAWSDVSSNPDANELGAELYREMVRRTVNDPELAEALSPRGFPIGCKRPVIDSNYFETFNRDNVTLVDLRKGGIETITATGIQTAQGHFELDVIVFATGFDAMTGALTRIDIRGRDGVALRDAWADGPRTLPRAPDRRLPEPVHGHGPGEPVGARQHGGVQSSSTSSGSARASPTCATTASRRSSRRPRRRTPGSTHVNEVAEGTMFTASDAATRGTSAPTSPGSRGCSCPTSAGCRRYIEKVDAIAAAGYEGFRFG